jgi:hypothetical protein
VSPPTFTPPTNPITGQPVPVNTYADPATGQSFITISPGQVAAFEDGCMPLDINVPINAGGGTVSNVSLLTGFAGTLPMTQVAPGVWHARIDCVESGDLAVQYTLTEDGQSETFIVPIGGIALIDPAGVIYDQRRYDAAVGAGASPDQARAANAIEGATVRLQRKGGDGAFRNVLSGDPGISPHVNPEVTGANGQFQWLTDAGVYRVVVSKPGYVTATSREVTIPPEVTDLHVGLLSTSVPQPPDADGDGVPNSADACPNVAARTPNGCPAAVVAPPPPATTAKRKACAGMRGAKLAKCKRQQKLAKAIAACKKGKKSKRAVCIRRAKALSKCQAITGRKNAKKKKRCVAKAKRIGRKQ